MDLEFMSTSYVDNNNTNGIQKSKDNRYIHLYDQPQQQRIKELDELPLSPPTLVTIQSTILEQQQYIIQTQYSQPPIIKQATPTQSTIITVPPAQIIQPISLIVQIPEYFKSINAMLLDEYTTDQSTRLLYHDIFKVFRIQRNQYNSVEIIKYLLHNPYYKFLNSVKDIKIIKLFIEEQLDYFVTSARGAQDRNDKLLISFAVIIKLMRMQNAQGQLVYESLLAFLYCKLKCVFEDGVFDTNEIRYQTYFKSTFWNASEVPMIRADPSNLKIVSIIRKYSMLFWALLWIDPNEVIIPIVSELDFNSPEYTFIGKDRYIFSQMLKQFTQCRNYSIVPAISSLFDVLSQGFYKNYYPNKAILQAAFSRIEPTIRSLEIPYQYNGISTCQSLTSLGDCFEQGHEEFFIRKLVHDEGMLQIVRSKMSPQVDSNQVYDFYGSLFKNDSDERPKFYS